MEASSAVEREKQPAPAESEDEMFLSPDLKTMAKLEEESKESRPPLIIIWRNIFTFSLTHLLGLVGAYQFFFVAKWETCAWAFVLHYLGMFGITAGAHRLWSHRSFKATTTARIILMLCGTIAHQESAFDWARNHRCHHKWTDTDADPHNSKRGFFYAHVGWLLTRKSEKLKTMRSKIDISDLLNDPVLTFQRKHYYPLVLLLCFILPAVIPVYLWSEDPSVAFLVATWFRFVVTIQSTFMINSVSHMWGYQPYDTSISPVESVWTNIAAAGEGGHNFHHTFPQDYRASEFSYLSNWTTAVLDGMAYLGMVYDLKTVSEESIKRQKARKGDPAYAHVHSH